MIFTSYMQFHPLAYTVKLMIEMSMADLIRKVARQKNDMGAGVGSYELSIATTNVNVKQKGASMMVSTGGVVVQKEVIVESRGWEDHDQVSETSGKEQHDDDSPLRNESWGKVTYNTDITAGHNV